VVILSLPKKRKYFLSITTVYSSRPDFNRIKPHEKMASFFSGLPGQP